MVGRLFPGSSNLSIDLALQHALDERGGFDELIRTSKPRCLKHHVIHVGSYLCSEPSHSNGVSPRQISFANTFLRHRILSARAALTSGLACNAPSTTTEAMVARASSGVTSAAIVARPNTLISSIVPGATRFLKILAAIIPQTKIQTFSGGGLFDDLGMAFELVSNCRANEISPVGVEAVLHHQVDVAKIDVAEIDRDLFTVTRFRSQLMHIFRHTYHPYNIHMDGIRMAWIAVKGLFRLNTHKSRPQRICRRR